MKNIAVWIIEEKNKNNPYALDTFSDMTAKAVKKFATFSKRCDRFAEIYQVEINPAQREALHKWMCGYTIATSYKDMIKKLIELM